MRVRDGQNHAAQIIPAKPERQFTSQDPSFRPGAKSGHDLNTPDALAVGCKEKLMQAHESGLSRHAVQIEFTFNRCVSF
ncbi:hypothetical protein AA0242T_0017 [Acetobacter aceti NRIC 0242]|nr:hypothetical protein AA0242T_0017 [Acetobacter aceti NRIC 0242]